MEPSPFSAIARLHIEGIPFGFLSSLGERFLANLYAAIAKESESTVIFERNERGEVIGFVSGTLNISRCYTHVISRHPFSLGMPIIPKMLSVTNFKRAIETLRYAFQQQPNNTHKTEQKPLPELLSIVVSDTARGKGVGRKLVCELETFMKAHSYAGPYKVVTSADDPRSNAFYQSMGFTLYSEFHHHGNRMHEYRKQVA